MMKHLQYANALIPDEQREFIAVRGNILAFTIQDGPIKEKGVNGVQITDALRMIKDVYISLNESLPCEENYRTIDAINGALIEQELRTKNRTERGVEGTSEA